MAITTLFMILYLARGLFIVENTKNFNGNWATAAFVVLFWPALPIKLARY